MTSLTVILGLILVTVTTAEISKSLLFAGSSQDYLRFPLNDGSMSQQFSLCFWAKKSSNTHAMVWSFYDGTSTSYVYPGYYNLIMGDGSLNNGKLTSFSADIPRGTWLHLCYVWLYSRNFKVFLNGGQIATSSSSTGRTMGAGNVMLGNYIYDVSSRYVFGSELTNLNMYSKELTDTEISRLYEGGPCYEDQSTDSYRRLKWEDILTFSRNGDVKELYLSDTCELRRLKKELASTKITLNQTSATLEEKENLLEEKEGLLEEKEGLLEEKEGLLKEKEGLLEEKDSLLTNTTAQLKAANDLLNKTNLHSLYTQCAEDLQNATQQLSIKATHWDVLYQDEYLNQVLTDESLTELKSEWDYIDDFIGVNITDTIIQHLKGYHGHNKSETTSTWAVLDDFIGVTLTEKVVRHLEETHVIQTAEPCNSD